MDSPKAREPGTFSWQATLWHELTHVVTLQLSNQRVPRWLTEGISVYEEGKARPEWGREMEVPFAIALERRADAEAQGSECGLHAGPRPSRSPTYQASLLVDHIVSATGEARCGGCWWPTATVSKGRRRSPRDWARPSISCRRAFDAALETRFAALLRGAARTSARPTAERAEARRRPRRVEDRGHGGPAQLPAQLALGRALAEAGRQGRVRAARESAAGADAGRDRRGQPARGHGPAGREARRSAAGDQGRIGPLLDQRSHGDRRRAAASRRWPRRPATRQRCDSPGDRVVALDPFDARGAQRGSAGIALKRKDAGDRGP